MSKFVDEIDRLVVLSEKSTQGEWRAILAQKYCHIKAAGIYVADPTPHMPWRNRDDADFIVALVNWFRANIDALRLEPVPEGFVRAVPDPLGRTMCTAQATGQWPFNECPPSGEMVMPREPTEAMLAAFADKILLTPNHVSREEIINGYRAMIAAAQRDTTE